MVDFLRSKKRNERQLTAYALCVVRSGVLAWVGLSARVGVLADGEEGFHVINGWYLFRQFARQESSPFRTGLQRPPYPHTFGVALGETYHD